MPGQLSKNKFMQFKKTAKSLLLISLCFICSACIPAGIVGSVGTLGFSSAQERSVGAAIDDASIEAKINALYLSSEDKDLFMNVDIDSVEGRVLLTGTVPSRQARIRAYKYAWKPEGVKEVINEVEVNRNKKFSVADTASDVWITTKVESKLLFAKNISSINYSVETIDGVVYLMGVAKNRDELKRAAEIAADVKGVRRVVSHVRLKDSPFRKQNLESADGDGKTFSSDN